MNHEPITLRVGTLQTNCYLVTDKETGKTLIIDPGDEADFITTTILENKLIPIGILLSHGHYDHCLGVLELKLNFNIPIYLHQADIFLYQNMHKSNSYWASSGQACLPAGRGRGTTPTAGWRGLKPPPIDHFIIDNQIITFGNSSLQVIHTPGHTPGSCCFATTPRSLDEVGQLFTGDTLFASGVGSADHQYSSKPDLKNSLSKLKSMIHDSSFMIQTYPGHEDYGFKL